MAKIEKPDRTGLAQKGQLIGPTVIRLYDTVDQLVENTHIGGGQAAVFKTVYERIVERTASLCAADAAALTPATSWVDDLGVSEAFLENEVFTALGEMCGVTAQFVYDNWYPWTIRDAVMSVELYLSQGIALKIEQVATNFSADINNAFTSINAVGTQVGNLDRHVFSGGGQGGACAPLPGYWMPESSSAPLQPRMIYNGHAFIRFYWHQWAGEGDIARYESIGQGMMMISGANHWVEYTGEITRHDGVNCPRRIEFWAEYIENPNDGYHWRIHHRDWIHPTEQLTSQARFEYELPVWNV